MEKATSQDGPNFQRSLSRVTGDKNIVEVLAQHGNYLDDLLDWDFVPSEKKFYLCSSYKMMDKIDIEDRKSTRLNSSHVRISYAVFCLKKKTERPEPDACRA